MRFQGQLTLTQIRLYDAVLGGRLTSYGYELTGPAVCRSATE